MASARGSDIAPSRKHFAPYAGVVWRVVESQNVISSDRLVEDPDDQPLLEQLIEAVKPPVPRAARHLPRLLATPFRYGHLPASRFRRANERPGIFYAAEAETTSVAEMAFHRLRFLSRSPGVKPPTTIIEHASFKVRVAVKRALDLTAHPFVSRRAEWSDPDDYAACQGFAARARRIATQLIRYQSVRDPRHGANLAVFDPAGLDGGSLQIVRNWHFRFERGRLNAYAAFPSPQHLAFTFEQFGLVAEAK